MMGRFVPTVLSKPATSADLSQAYIDSLINDYGASEVWPLVDIASGTTITAAVDSARNGTLTGWDLQNAAGPVTGTLAPYSDGANDYGDILTSNGSTGLEDIHNATIGSFFMWGKVANAGVWTDGTTRYMLYTSSVGANFQVLFHKIGANNSLRCTVSLGAVSKLTTISTSTTDWFSIGVSYKDSNNGDEAIVYFNGVAETPVSGFAEGSGLTAAYVGASNSTPASVWHGWFAYPVVKYGSIWSAADFLSMHNAAG